MVAIDAALIAHYAEISRHVRVPQVKALHLPPLATRGKHSAFCVLELADGTPGLAYVSLGDTHARLRDATDSFVQSGADPFKLLAGLSSDDGARRALALAAGNAVARWLWTRGGFVPPGDDGSLAGIVLRKGMRIGMVGLFAPLIERIVAHHARLSVLELDPALVGEFEGYSVSLDPAVLSDCEAVLCTSTVLLSGGFEQLRAAARQARPFVLIGPGAGVLPQPLFDCGVDALGGTWVEDGPAVIDAVCRGESWSRYARKTLLRAGDCPDALLLARQLGCDSEAPD